MQRSTCRRKKICNSSEESFNINGTGELNVTLTPTFLRRSPTMLRAEILAEGVRDELPQPLVNAAKAHKLVLVYKSVNFISEVQ